MHNKWNRGLPDKFELIFLFEMLGFLANGLKIVKETRLVFVLNTSNELLFRESKLVGYRLIFFHETAVLP